MSATHSQYFMDDPREAGRLRAKVDAGAWVRAHFLPHIASGSAVLEVGCGPGALLDALLEADPSLRGTGIDLSAERIALATRSAAYPSRATFLCGDANHLEHPSASYDAVYSRFLLEYLPNKAQAVNEMFRVCRPGGVVILQDLDGQLMWHYPEPPELMAGLGIVLDALGETGFDPFAGRKLYALARKAGAVTATVTAQSYHLIAGSIDEANRRLWELKLDIATPAISRALGSAAEARRIIDLFLAHLDHPESITYSTLFTVVGKKLQ